MLSSGEDLRKMVSRIIFSTICTNVVLNKIVFNIPVNFEQYSNKTSIVITNHFIFYFILFTRKKLQVE